MADDHNRYAAPSGPPPTYGSQVSTPQSTGGPYYNNSNNNHYGQVVPYNNQTDLRAPDQAYGGYSSPPPGGFYGPNNNAPSGQPGYVAHPSGYWNQQPQMQSQPQPMYYAVPYGPPAGYHQDSRGTSAGTGICAGLLGACAFCCCLDLLF